MSFFVRAALILALVPAGASAQFSYPNLRGCGEVQSCAAVSYEATTTTGVGFTCNAALEACIDLGPGTFNQIGTNGSGHILLGPPSVNTIVRVGDGTTITGNGDWTNTNGVLDLLFNAYMTNSQTRPVLVDDVQGFRLAPKAIASLPECGSAEAGEGTQWMVLAAGSVPTGLCLCTSDGAGTPAYAWVRINLQAGTFTLGTSTTCAP